MPSYPEYPVANALIPDATPVVLHDAQTALGSGFRDILAMLRRNKLLVVSTVALAFALALVYMLLVTPIYRAAATVQVEEQSARVLKSEDIDRSRDSVDAERFLQTQLDIIRSRSIALAVAQELGLIGNSEFLKSMNISPDVKAQGVLSQRDSERETVLKVLQDNLDVNLPIDSRIVTISFRSPDPVLAARVANSYADNFIKANLQRKYDTSSYAREFLSKQLEEAKKQLEKSERDALNYSRAARLVDVSNAAKNDGSGTDGGKSLTTALLVRLNAAYGEALATRIAAQQKWNQASGAGIMSLPEVLANPAIQELVQRRAEARAAYEDQRQTRKDDYPTVRQAKAQITELDSQIKTLADNIRSTLKSQYTVAQGAEDALKQRMRSVEADTLAEQDRNVQLSILQRATDTNRTLYDTLMQRYRELSAESGIQPNNIQIVDRADVPAKPVSPRLFITLVIAGLGGLFTGLALIFVKNHLDDTIRSAEDLSYKLGLPLLGAVPSVRSGGIVKDELADPKSAVSEAFNAIRASLLLSSRNGMPKSLLFTSTQPSEGKSTCVFALSTGLGKLGKAVVVIDCDLRRPSQHDQFAIVNQKGVSDLLAGQATIDEVLCKTDQENVWLITCGSIPPNPTELLSSSSFKSVLAELQARFDVVIADAPPILGLADAVLLGAELEATVMVVESGRNHHGGSKAGVGRLQKSGTNILGVILTKQDVRNNGYGYEYSYTYRYGSGSDDKR